MSRISEISQQYHKALVMSQNQYKELYEERVDATENFYRVFFKNLVCNIGVSLSNERFRQLIQEKIERITKTNTLQFIAIDGTCNREVFSEWVTFFGGAYGARGEIKLNGGKHQITYKRWSLDHDVSMVAWIPVPFAKLSEVINEGENFINTEEEKLNLASIHVQIMQLSEIFLAYNTISSSRLDAPHILLMDLSPSSVLASVSHAQDKIGFIGYPYDRRELTPADITIALSHPFSESFNLPSPKNMDLYRIIVSELHKNQTEVINIKNIASKFNINENKLKKSANYLVNRGILETLDNNTYSPVVKVNESWSYTKEFFQNICYRLFIKKDPTALQYSLQDENGTSYHRWLSPNDLGFLIGVGMRLLIEQCWDKNILFYGVVKDSASQYLTRNFLGVALETNFYPELKNLKINMLPWTDRIFCETLPLIDDELITPWCTIEFDSAFMTLHRGQAPHPYETQVAGVRGIIVNQERVFMKSLGQFFLRRDKVTPLMGHVVFLERLVLPNIDIPNNTGPKEIMINTEKLGCFPVYAWHNNLDINWGQYIMMYLLSVLTRNHFAEAIGYPDPLHKADWGAKTIGRQVSETIKSSAKLMAARPLSRTFRDIRSERRR